LCISWVQGVPGDTSLLDSDSDLEDIRHVIIQSRSQLVFSEHVFSKQLAKASPELLLASDFVSNLSINKMLFFAPYLASNLNKTILFKAEIVATCQENIRCLRVILDNVEEGGGLLSTQECRDIRGE
jgi:hypothetical protein